MDLLSLGLKSRKTGLRPKQNLKKDKYLMENLDEFFSDNDEVDDEVDEDNSDKGNNKGNSNNVRDNFIDSKPYKIPIPDSNTSNRSYRTIDSNFNHIARKINFDNNNKDVDNYNFPVSLSSKNTSKKKNKKSPLRSPLPEHKTKRLFLGETVQEPDIRKPSNNTINTSFEDSEDKDLDYNYIEYNDDAITNEPDLEPNFDSNLSPISMSRDSQGSTPNPSNKISKRPQKSAASFTKRIAVGKSSKKKSNSKRQFSSSESDLDDAQNNIPEKILHLKKRPKISNDGGTPREIVIKPSPLPSPPPENSKSGLRRSKRTRLKPLAYWRNERINYVQSDVATDPNTTLAKDIHNIPLQTIESWVEVQENDSVIPKTRKTTPPKDRKDALRKKSDRQQVPGIEGTEWFSSGKLELNVFSNEVEVPKTVAFTSDGMDFKGISDNQHDNFEVAALFSEDKDICASGFMDFPINGAKGSKASNDILFIFFVVLGLFEVKLGNNQFVVSQGCSFQIPPGNFYSFKNLFDDKARLFFVQTRIAEPELDNNWDQSI